MKALSHPPSIDSLSEAPERAALHLLAVAAQCARNATLVEYRQFFEAQDQEWDDELNCETIWLIASQLRSQIDALLCMLRLYETTLRYRVQAAQSLEQLRMPF